MQIVVDIPGWLYNAIMECKEPHYSKSLGEAVRDGKPLDDVLGRIKEEIKDNTYFINEITEKEGIDFETVEKIIDKYMEESEDKE